MKINIKSKNGTIIAINEHEQENELLSSQPECVIAMAIKAAGLTEGDSFFIELNDTNLLIAQPIDGSTMCNTRSVTRYNYTMTRHGVAEAMAQKISKILGQHFIQHNRYDGSIVTYNWYNLTVV